MTKREKRLQRIRQNPNSVTFEEMRQVLEDHGFDLKRSSGSQHVFRATVGNRVWNLSIPFRKPHVKPHYVQDALQAIDEIIAFTSDSEGEELDDDNY